MDSEVITYFLTPLDTLVSRGAGMSWTERHLGRSLIFFCIGASFLPYMVGFLLGTMLGEINLILGPIICMILYAYVAAWHVQKRDRGPWNALWIFVPFGFILLLCLKDLAPPTLLEPTLKECTQKERLKIYTIY
ncbi:hypothetical protein ACFLU0_01345 [Chloroflexota bacterium]